MNRKRTNVALVLGVLVLIALLIPLGDSESPTPPLPQTSASAQGSGGPIRPRKRLHQSEVPSAPDDESRPDAIVGQVVDATTADPLEGALVCAVIEGGNTQLVSGLPHAVSDNDGRFTVRRITERDAALRVIVRKSGYLEASVAVGDDPLEIRLSTGKSISGRVRDLVGRPLDGVIVVAAEPRVAGAMRLSDEFVVPDPTPPNHGSATSDATGDFRVSGLRDGLVRVRAGKRGWRIVGFPKPQAPDTATSIPILDSDSFAVVAGTDSLEIVMEPVWVGAVRVVDARSGAEIPVASVAQENVELRPGKGWALVAAPDRDWFRGDEPSYTARRAYYRRLSDADDLQLLISAPGYVSERIRFAPRGPGDPDYLEPRVVALEPLAETGRLELAVSVGSHAIREPILLQVLVPGQSIVSSMVLDAQIDSGLYRVELPAGSYRIAVLGLALSSTFDGKPCDVDVVVGETHQVDLALDAGIGVFTLLEPSGARLGAARVRVTSNERFARSWVLVPADSSAAKTARWADLLGSNTPGEYRVLLNPGSYRVAARCLGYADAGHENIQIAPGVETQVSLQLETPK